MRRRKIVCIGTTRVHVFAFIDVELKDDADY